MKTRIVVAVLVLVAVSSAQMLVELPIVLKVPVLVHTPEEFAEKLADTVSERVAVMLDERLRCLDVTTWRAWHMRLLKWHDIHGLMDPRGDDLDLRQVARWMP